MMTEWFIHTENLALFKRNLPILTLLKPSVKWCASCWRTSRQEKFQPDPKRNEAAPPAALILIICPRFIAYVIIRNFR